MRTKQKQLLYVTQVRTPQYEAKFYGSYKIM